VTGTRAPHGLQRPRNDPEQYEDLAAVWWQPRGPFSLLHWIAKARAALVPPAARPGAVLVDLGCGAGLLAPHLAGKGYRHVGIDLSPSALALGRDHGMQAVRGDVLSLPLPDGIADTVSAGEILEHVTDLGRAVAEACRVLRPGGTLVIDTIAATFLARLLAVEVAERIPGGAPPGIHDPALFVDRRQLVALCRSHGVSLVLSGLRPSIPETIAWLRGKRSDASMVRTWSTSVLFQGVGVKAEQ